MEDAAGGASGGDPDLHAGVLSGKLYVGSASREESLSISPGYVCCTFRGSESAIDAATGKVIWKRYMITEAAKERAKTRRGAKVTGPSGAGIWTAATLDPAHDTLYVVTGDNYSEPATALSDALVALQNVQRGDAMVQTIHVQGRLQQLVPTGGQSELPG